MSKFTQDTNGLKVFHRGYWSAVSSEVYYQLQLKILGTVSLLYFDTIHKKLNLQFQELVEVNIIYAVLLEFIGWLLHLIQVLLQVRFTTNGICAKNNTHIYVVQTSNNRVIAPHDLYCCLLPQCEALRTCCSDFSIAWKWCCRQDLKVGPSPDFMKRTCGQCSSL